MIKNRYSLRESKKIFLSVYHLYSKQKKRLTDQQNQKIYAKLKALEEALLEKNREKASEYADEIKLLPSAELKKTSFEKIRDILLALAFALGIAVLIRQMWFELYEIPTGSMRPTLKEQDRLTVSKTNFGINLPLTTKHLYFDNHLTQRGSIFIFTGANMPIRDVDTLYFYLFPGKKQYVKRLMGKPGDCLYFYGGLIYGIDSEDRDITPELQPPYLDRIDHIPFIHFEGKTTFPSSSTKGIVSPVLIHQMNEAVARLYLTPYNQPRGELINVNPAIKEYSELWGFKNFAMSRLLTRSELLSLTEIKSEELPESPLYLELQHHPSISSLQVVRNEKGQLRPTLSYTISHIPLNEEHLRTLFNALYTARFHVKNGIAYRFGLPESYLKTYPFLPHLEGVPDGCYEFYHGKAYEIKWQGLAVACPLDHPLYQFNIKRIQLLYNIGIEFDTHFMPQYKNQTFYPSRYSYYRNGDLYLMGSAILQKTDPTLIHFINEESKNASGFIDHGPPIKPNGQLDIDFIKQFGLKISASDYLALGDNHAMSADSRDFGFVPEDNLRGAPDFIFWPPGSRWGAPNQTPYPLFNLPRTIIWITAAVGIGIWWRIHRRRTKLPLL